MLKNMSIGLPVKTRKPNYFKVKEEYYAFSHEEKAILLLATEVVGKDSRSNVQPYNAFN